ncbi:hypothetical protein AVEN_60638-1 [Araneus ventricosus]|uniref:Uncharacterized protein n=1 Tax=Araneus ventricosus TaxID=182803 RepID=A0A4Y2KX55_ARAVE|nr:hypothetical protein AVEN_60638-1 [Araneus ventricosus]
MEDTVTKIVLWVYGGSSPTHRILENEDLFANMQKKHVVQVTGTALLQISNTNSKKFTNDDSTALSIALSSPAFQLALQTKLQSHSSRSTHSYSVIQARSFYTLPDRP